MKIVVSCLHPRFLHFEDALDVDFEVDGDDDW